MASPITIERALTDKRLLGAALGDLATWQVWIVVLKVAFGLPLDEAERSIFASVAGNRAPPSKRVRELWCVIGRRGGKSRVAAALAIYLACFVKHKLAAGERGMVLVLAASVEQAKTVFSYAKAFLTSSPVLAKEIEEATSSEIRLRNGVIIGMHACSYKTVRGRTLLGCVFDEVSFWRSEESAMPDIETYRAVLPSLATTDGMLIGISTPYRKVGLLHQKHRDYFGNDDADTLVVSGGSKLFNPSLSDAVIDAQRAVDPTAASAEWDAQFRADLASYLDDATIDAAIDYGRPLELPPRSGLHYKAFIDASGGRHDHFTVAVGHRDREHGRFIIDCVRGIAPPFDPSNVTKEFAALIKFYRCTSATGDAYSAEWVKSEFSRNGIHYRPSDLNKSEIYLETLVLYTRGLVSLPDHPRLLRELRLLERHTHRSGRDTVDHGRSGSDDHANSVAGALRLLVTSAADWSAALGLQPVGATVKWQHPPAPMTVGEYMDGLRWHVFQQTGHLP
jgi:hypothetical protein